MTLEPAGTRSIFLNRNRDWCSNNHYTLNPSFFSADDKTLINLNSFKILLQACRHNNKLNTRTREGMKGKRSLQVFMRGRGVPSLHEALLKRSSILNLQVTSAYREGQSYPIHLETKKLKILLA